MTLEELYNKCIANPDLIPGYIKTYKELRLKEIDRIGSLQFKDLGVREEFDILPSRTKGVVIGLIRQALQSNNDKIKKIDDIILELKHIKEVGCVRPKNSE